MNSEASMVGYYAKRANEYERIYQKPERQKDLKSMRHYVEGAFVDADVFEVACGTGYWTEILARSAASVLAVDINEEVLTIARGKNLNSQQVTFRREDAYALPLLSRKYTAGFSAFWWSHVPKSRIHNFLLGFHRMLAPGAHVVFIDNIYVECSNTPISRIDENGNTYQVRRLANGSAHEVLKNFPTETELHNAIKGLATNAQIELLQFYWILSYELS